MSFCGLFLWKYSESQLFLSLIVDCSTLNQFPGIGMRLFSSNVIALLQQALPIHKQVKSLRLKSTSCAGISLLPFVAYLVLEISSLPILMPTRQHEVVKFKNLTYPQLISYLSNNCYALRNHLSKLSIFFP